MINKKEVLNKIETLSKEYKKAIIYFHKDCDGVTTAIAVKELLKEYNINTVDSCIIQYGAEQYSVKKVPNGTLGVLVDFASGNSQYHLQFDHHQEQRGNLNGNTFTIAEPKSSNLEIVNNLIKSKKNKFSDEDVNIVRIIDSADYFNNSIDINEIIYLDKPSKEIGIEVNKLILAYKNKYLHHNDKKINILEYIVNNCSASLSKIYSFIKEIILYKETFTFDWDRKKWIKEPLPSLKKINENRLEFLSGIQHNENIKSYSNGLLICEKIGDITKTGAYERYGLYKNEDCNYLINVFEFGFLQISKNPFKQVKYDIDLSKVSKEALFKFKPLFQQIYISIFDIKVQNESNISKIKNKVSYTDMVGFGLEDLLSFGYTIKYKNNNNEVVNLDTNDSDLISNLKAVYDKYHKYIIMSDKAYLSALKVSLWDLVLSYSGGHKYITNISALSFIDYRSELESSVLVSDTLCKYGLSDRKDLKLSYKLALCLGQESKNILLEKIEQYEIDEDIIYLDTKIEFGSNAVVEDSAKK